MKTASVNYLPQQTSVQVQFVNLNHITTYIMKKLTNVSPFLLLLVPVFMMMVLTLTSGTSNTQNDEVAKTTTTSKSILKVEAVSFK